MQTVLMTGIFLMLWLCSCAGSFFLGTAVPGRKKRTGVLQKQEAESREREKREMENFWSYDGTRQEPIN